MDFYEKIENEIEQSDDTNVYFTENGARGYRSTGKALLDLNFSVPSLRGASEELIFDKFKLAFIEDSELALKWLFYVRDVREGMGERNLFRIILTNMLKIDPSQVCHLIKLIPIYGRWDDLLCILDVPTVDIIALEIIKNQYIDDLNRIRENGFAKISLLGKWLPSINTSSFKTRQYAKKIIKYLGTSEKHYRKSLSLLRDVIDVVEKKMSSNQWDEINYATVPSRANLIYRNAFIKHDHDRRLQYINDVMSGKEKVNSDTLYPHEIVSKMFDIIDLEDVEGLQDEIDFLTVMWENFKNLVEPGSKTIVVSDGSGSMYTNINSNTKIIYVAISIALYFAEKLTGEFNNKFITFSENPRLIDLSKCISLFDKIRHIRQYNEIANTNIEKVFELILNTAINNQMKQEDMPENILIISDMEFDGCARDEYGSYPRKRLFEKIKDDFEKAGYKLPKLIFWNVGSRTNTIPLKENDMGVILISGFSINAVRMVINDKTDPYECLVDQLNSDRYKPIISINHFLDNIKEKMVNEKEKRDE